MWERSLFDGMETIGLDMRRGIVRGRAVLSIVGVGRVWSVGGLCMVWRV